MREEDRKKRAEQIKAFLAEGHSLGQAKGQFRLSKGKIREELAYLKKVQGSKESNESHFEG